MSFSASGNHTEKIKEKQSDQVQADYDLSIIAADRVFFTGRCESMIVPAYDGQKEILAHHESMLIAVEEGITKFRPAGGTEWKEAVTGKGFVQIFNNRVTLLTETAERPEEIDMARAQEAKERAEEQLRQKQSIQEYYHTSASLARAMSRLKAAGRIRV